MRAIFLILLIFLYGCSKGSENNNTSTKCELNYGEKSSKYLPADEAFKIDITGPNENKLKVSILITPGYFVYKDRFKIRPLNNSFVLLDKLLPSGTPVYDNNFGKTVDIFCSAVEFETLIEPRDTPITFDLIFQGGAQTGGLAYPPTKKTFTL